MLTVRSVSSSSLAFSLASRESDGDTSLTDDVLEASEVLLDASVEATL